MPYGSCRGLARSGLGLLVAVNATILVCPLPGVAKTTPPLLPQVYLDTTPVPPTGQMIAVSATGDLQAALDAAEPGDVIQLQAGATYTGNFTLPNKSGTGWIYIQSSVLASLVPAGIRVGPAHAMLMPKIVTPNSSSALTTATNAHHYRFIGVEITGTLADTTATQFGLITLDSGADFVFDRCYIHGTPTGNYKRGIQLNSARTAVIDSYLSDFHSTVQDAQAIMGWNGPGPFKLVNNYIEGSGENVMFGGADPSEPNLVPSDIEIRRNYFFKPLSWRVGDPSYAGIPWVVKNLLELKNAQRVLIAGNLFENNWQDAQGGTAILFTVRNQSGTAPWSVVQDVTFTHNIVRYVGQSVGMHGTDDLHPSQPSARFLIRNNLLVDNTSANGSGWLFNDWRGIIDLTIDHNTGLMDQAIMMAGYGPNPRFVYTNNLTPAGAYGFAGDGTNQGLATLTAYFPSAVFDRNLLTGGNASLYPADNFFPLSLEAVGFVDLAGGNYRLSALSPYKNAGTDGADIGVDFNLLDLATSCAISGVCISDPDMIPPTVAISAPASGAMVVGTITVSASATDNVGTVGVQFKLDGANLGAEVTSAPYSVFWNTRNVLDGTHVLTAVARDAAGNTATSAGISVRLVNADATAPTVTITSPTSSSTYSTSTSPLALGGIASDNTGVAEVTWRNDRGGSGTATGTTSWTASGIVLQLGTNVLTVTARDGAGNTATVTVTVTLAATFTFTDDPLTSQGTPLKAAHILEVRAAVDSLRVSCGLATFAWTDPTLAPGSTSVKAVHFSELRTALNQAYQAAGRALPTYTDPTLTPGQTVVQAAHLTELRAATRALEEGPMALLGGPRQPAVYATDRFVSSKLRPRGLGR